MENILLGLIGLGAVFYLGRLAYRQVKGSDACACSKGCQGCRMKEKEDEK
ncbi:MAG: hypothetical protein E6713_04100 [Sporomusaceae bacterium]|nr:hypothetical protein [Sporomusaceae bacterium]